MSVHQRLVPLVRVVVSSNKRTKMRTCDNDIAHSCAQHVWQVAYVWHASDAALAYTRMRDAGVCGRRYESRPIHVHTVKIHVKTNRASRTTSTCSSMTVSSRVRSKLPLSAVVVLVVLVVLVTFVSLVAFGAWYCSSA